MADKALMIELFKAMLNEDNAVRGLAEKRLLEAASQNADAFVNLAFQVIEDQTVEAGVRNCACIVLKRVLTVYDDDQVKGYRLLSAQGKQSFQRGILLLLSKEQVESVRDKICDLISDVGSSVSLDETIAEADKWNSLLQHLFELFQTNTDSAILSVFRIFDGLFANIGNSFSAHSESIFKLFQFGLNHNSIPIALTALEALGSLVQTVKAKDLRVYKPLGVSVLSLAQKLTVVAEEENLQSCVGCIYDICESEPSFLKARFDELLKTMSAIRNLKTDPDNALKTESVECIIFMIERYPGLIKDQPSRLEKVLEMVFLNMMEIEEEVPAEWCSPVDGFNDDFEEDDDQKHIKVGMDFIDRLMVAIDQQLILGSMNAAVQHLLASSDWKMHHAAIMAMSQLGEYMLERIDSDVLNILKQVQLFASNPNPRIRYACCHLLGQFADDLQPDFQEQHKDIYFATILPLLNDPVPRVVAHALASLTNFLENATKDQIGANFSFIYERIMFWLANGIGYVKEACLSVLSALCEGSGDLFFPVYDQTMIAIFQVFAQAKSKVQKQMRGNAIECATIIGKICGLERFEKYYPALIQEMITIQNSDIDLAGFDPQKSYILSGWQRMVIAIEDRFKPFIAAVLPRVLEIAKSGHSASSGDAVRTSDSEETEIAVQTLSVFLDNLGTDLGPYLPDIYNVLYLIIENSANDETRVEAAKSLPPLIKIYKKTGQDISQFCLHVNQTLWALMDRESDPSTLAEFAFTIQKTLKNMGEVLSDAQLVEVYKKCLEHLQKSAARKQNLADNFDKDEENPQEVEDIIQGDNQLEDEFALEIANVIGVLFKTYKQRSLPIFGQVMTDLIIPASKDVRLKSKHFAMFLIDDAVEHIGEFIPKDVLSVFLDILASHGLDSSLELRQAAVFGIGITALALGEAFKPRLNQTIQMLWQAIEMKKSADDFPKFFLTVRDNAVASLGKLLQAFGGSMTPEDLSQGLRYWLKQLPILHDHKEATQQHQFLLSLVTSEPPVLPLSDPEVLKKAIEVFSQIHQRKKLCKEEMNNSIDQLFNALKNNQQIRTILGTLTLTDSETEFLKRYLA